MAEHELEIRFDDAQWERLQDRLKDRAADWKPAAKLIHREMTVRVDSMFKRLRLGGRHRGETWRYFAPQYIRKDGTVVPAWGGVPYARGRGTVKGRKRPSGARVKRGDAVGQDTVNLRRNALLALRTTKTRLRMGSNVDYADDFAARRPFAFFHLPSDLNMMREKIIQYFERGA